MDVNQILITEYAFRLLKYLNVFTTYHMQKENICLPFTSLGRSAGTNPFVEYRSLTGQMGYSKNRRTFVLYSGMISAFLQNNDLSTDNSWYHPSLRYARDWLQQNNPYLSAYHSIASHLSAHNSQTSPTVWPQATQVLDSNSEFVSPAHL